ncbi:uncharacterized protein JN550_000842 [Neoarthrinium moseri]|uniref:uncharacterized protein n=1 Tax=Neoarthrinium moseri TaxID=1658444 RepID=UPI001FDCD854|nr:uncharacterized protein JN550_000842 [Neoarthrinium moseri]KAI1876770.1 hypothetical protein JN550_000842 [Neoarthrinium moseri]
MAVEVEDLIIQPFRELIERGNEAIANAETAQDVDPALCQAMLKAGRAVIREGERALQRVQPLILGRLEKHGDALREAIRQNDGIFESQRQLEDVLYDLDDYIQPDTFDATKFALAQTASKAFALSALETIKRLRVDDEAPVSPAYSASRFPPLPPLPQGRVEPLSIPRPSTRTEHRADTHLLGQNARTTPHIGRALSSSVRSSPGEANLLRRMSTRKSQKSLAPSTSSSDSQYSQPSFQWSQPERATRGYHTHHPSDYSELLGIEIENLLSEPSSPRLLEPHCTTGSDSKTPWTTAWINDQAVSADNQIRREALSVDAAAGQGSADGHESPTTTRFTFESTRRYQETIPENSTTDHVTEVVDDMSPVTKFTHDRMRRHSHSVFDHNGLSRNGKPMTSSPIDQVSGVKQHPLLATNAQRRTSLDHTPISIPYASTVEDKPPAFVTHFLGHRHTKSTDAAISTQVVASPPRPAQHPKPIWYTREEKCWIEDDSTFEQLDGFCEGALAFRDGRIEEATKTTVILDAGPSGINGCHDTRTGAALSMDAMDYVPLNAQKPVMQCSNCKFHQPLLDFKRDCKSDPKARSSMEGVSFRIRFLYKSHLSVGGKSSPLYGCIFCTHLGHTPREGDATVFASQEQLFRHLAQHPQPLPEVPGVTVLYGKLEDGDRYANSYDIHLPEPPRAGSMTSEPSLLSKRPTAIAVKSHTQKPFEKPMKDPSGRKDVLQFLVGARIIGVEFPNEWGGKWCLGWHDGVRGSFPAKLVTLEEPPKSDIRLPGTNNDGVIVTSRWKWEAKHPSAGWLTFDKNTVLTNVSWLSHDSWCWSGTTKDGRTGFFPSSHIKPDSIRDPPGSVGAFGATTKKDSRRLFKIRHSKSISSSGSSFELR